MWTYSYLDCADAFLSIYVYFKTYQVVCFKYEEFILYQLYLNKTFKSTWKEKKNGLEAEIPFKKYSHAMYWIISNFSRFKKLLLSRGEYTVKKYFSAI